MNIVVCVKQVPDSWAEKKLDPADNTLDRGSADAVMNELDEYAIEEALRIKESLGEGAGAEVVVLTMGPDNATDTIRKALSMGADRAIHVIDDALHGSDAPATSAALAAALGKTEFDLVILGSESTDARTSVVPAMLAERLGLPQLTYANKVDVDTGATPHRITIQRQTDYGYDKVEGSTPAIISVVEKINEPRYPSFKGIMAAKKKPVETFSLADLSVDASTVGLAGSWTKVEDFAQRPPRSAGTIHTDEGDGGTKIAEFLTAQKFV